MDAQQTHEVLPQRSRERRKRVVAETTAEPAPTSTPTVTMRERAAGMDGGGVEYLDHTADVQIHSWAASLEETLEWQVLGMFGYMTDRSMVAPTESISVRVDDAHDINSLLYKLMDEFLFHFSAEFFTVHELRITLLDQENWALEATAWGERWDRTKHPCGTEVKAITFQCMQVTPPGEDDVEEERLENNRVDVPKHLWNSYVIIDI